MIEHVHLATGTTVGCVCTLTEWLRGRSDDQLRELLTARPDLVHPVPAHLGTLAERAMTHSSVARALDRLDHATLRALEAASVLSEWAEPVRDDDLLDTFPEGDTEAAREAVERLRKLALIWGDDDTLRVVPAVRAILVRPAGLGPPAATCFRDLSAPERLRALLTDLGLADEPGPAAAADALARHVAKPDVLDDLLASAGAEARTVLDRLTWGPPAGEIADADRQVRLATAASPIDQLLARALLVPADATTVVLPREVALHLRGGKMYQHPDPPPPLETRDRGAQQAERTAAGQAFTAIRTVEELLELWSVDPPSVLRAGGLGVRDLRRAARELSVTEDVAALHMEVAYAAGLLGSGAGVDGDWLPTKAYDVWRRKPPQQRWATLASAWLETSRVPGLVGERDERDKRINALGHGLYRTGVRETRRHTLDLLAQLAPGEAPSGDSVRERLAWLRPRRWERSREQLVSWTLSEAETLGVTGLGALPAYGRALLGESPDSAETAAEALAPLLPEPVDHVLVQPDLTVVAPGPLTQELARELALTADVESTGAATVYRFTQSSVRRALDAGRSASDLLAMLEQHSRTPIPQPLRYLVEDVARSHGRIRVGTASAYIRCDDPATLTELLANRRTAELGLRRLADTVLASRTGRQELVERLRTLGYAPMAESAEGDLLVTRAEVKRSDGRNHHPQQAGEGPQPDGRLATAAVRALRAGDRAATASRRPLGGNGAGSTGSTGSTGSSADASADGQGEAPPRSPAAQTVAALRSASGDGQQVWIGYLDAQGHASSRIVEPVRVEGGFLTAYDSTRDAVHRFALHRITGVAALDEETQG